MTSTDFMVQFHNPVCEIRISPGLELEFVKRIRETIVVEEQWIFIAIIRDLSSHSAIIMRHS